MIVHDFNCNDIAFAPDEAQAPLIVDPDAVLARAIAPQGFKLVAGRDAQEIQRSYSVQLLQLAQYNIRDCSTDATPRLDMLKEFIRIPM